MYGCIVLVKTYQSLSFEMFGIAINTRREIAAMLKQDHRPTSSQSDCGCIFLVPLVSLFELVFFVLSLLFKPWSKMAGIELIHNFTRSLDDFHRARRIRMTAERDLIVADR